MILTVFVIQTVGSAAALPKPCAPLRVSLPCTYVHDAHLAACRNGSSWVSLYIMANPYMALACPRDQVLLASLLCNKGGVLEWRCMSCTQEWQP